MRDKARYGTEKARRTLRNRSLRIGIGLAVLFAFGLMASGAFGESLSVVGLTGTDTTASSAATTDATSPPSTDTSSTDTSSSSTDTTTTDTTPAYTPTVTTDKQDYAPGSVVTITGAGWPGSDDVNVFVNDTIGNTWSHTDAVTTDANGGFTDQVTLPNTFISNYTVTASDASGLQATSTFTDGNIPNAVIQGQNNPACTSPSPCPWQTTNASGWAELQPAPLRLFIPAGHNGDSQTFTISLDHANGTTLGLDGLVNWSKSSNVSGITISPTTHLPTSGVTFTSSGTNQVSWNYAFTITMSDNNAGEIDFFTSLLAGAHQFGGASLQVKGAGTFSFVKPNAAPGNVNLSVTKTALTSVSPGQTLNYSLSYHNAGPSGATNTQLTDVLPAGVTYVTGSCSGNCTYDPITRELSWTVGSLANGANGTRTYQVTVNSNDANNSTFTNDATIFSAENDTATGNNQASVTTTVKVPSISGTVIDDGTSGGLAGAIVRLCTTTDCSGSGNPVSTVTTDATGNWSFSGTGVTTNKTYYVVRANPSGYTSTSAVAGTGNLSTATVQTSDRIQVVLGATGTYNSNNEFHASGIQATSLSVSNASGTYGGTANLSASLTSGATGVSGKTISFTLNGVAVCGPSTSVTCPTTDVFGTATLNSVSLSGINAGTYATAVGASFAGDSSFSSASGTGSLTVSKAGSTTTVDCSGTPFTYNGNPQGCTASWASNSTDGEHGTVTPVSYVGRGTTTYGPSTTAPTHVGTYTASAAFAGDGDHNASSTASTDFAISKKLVHVVAEDNTVQYSDPTPTLGWHFANAPSDFVSPDTGAVVNGQSTVTCSAPARDRLDSAAGTYPIGCDVTGLSATDYSFTVTAGTLTVTNENAFIEYSGDSFMTTASVTTSSATIKATAVIREAGATGAPSVTPPDTSLGNKLSTTQLRFSVYTFNGTTPQSTCTVSVAAGSTAGTGNTAASPCSFNLAAGDPYTIKIELLVNGYYVAADEAAAVTVSLPGTGFTTGGGWLNEPNLGTRSNFGFNVKRQKNGSVQGNSLYIYRKTVAANSVPLSTGGYLPAGDYNWQIKSNSWSGGGLSLNAGCNTTTNPFTNCVGTFSGKANIQAMSRTTGTVYSLGGNYNYRVDVTDNGEPGSKAATIADTYGIKVWSDTSGTYYQLYSGTPPPSTQFPQLSLNGGNIQVRP